MLFDVNYHTTSTGLAFLDVTSSQLRASGLSSAKLGTVSRHKGRIVYLAYDGDACAFRRGLEQEKIELKINHFNTMHHSDWILDLPRADGKGRE